MGIYLGQLPPAEIARLKAELAETLLANFGYPRFFDYRTESLQMRPVDRAKRQEVWLYLSSVDFTAWNRVDLTSPELQNQIERLFIQFVQRNRSFFGEQGRRRMSDIRMLIGTSAEAVVQRLRSHLTQRQTQPPFGSPRPVVSWSGAGISGRPEPTWEQIAPATMILQQQLQECRGEVRTAFAASEGKQASASLPAAANGATRRSTYQPPATSPIGAGGYNESQPTVPTSPLPPRTSPVPDSRGMPTPDTRGAPGRLTPAASVANAPGNTPGTRQPGQQLQSLESPIVARKSEPLAHSGPLAYSEPVSAPSPAPVATPVGRAAGNGASAPIPAVGAASTPSSSLSRNLLQFAQSSQLPNSVAPSSGQREIMSMGEDDIAIFEQMRQQLLIWLRVEAIKAGLEISGQGPAQLLDLLRQQARMDENHLQIVSTLLNLANQVIKTGLISVLDYKQALMFHLMHTR